VEYIVEAAKILASDETIQFELIGRGPERRKAIALARGYGLSNVSFEDWVDREKLPERMAAADVCLGVFGTTPQSMMTIQNKIYEALAMRKPVVTGDGAVVRGALNHREHVYLCERADPRSLAQAILTLKSDPDLCRQLAGGGYSLYWTRYDLEHNGVRCASCLHRLANPR
jgi:glycosyltransferase involved in cell wall biosynthesis